jgi:alpha-D-ribose 1-methylphosphonate 5-triphosphate synthase subunit PhnG
LALCKQIHRENVEREMDATVIVRALETCLQHVRVRRGGVGSPRAYIEYLALTLR